MFSQSMQAIILAGGKGTRLQEQSGDVPKALVEIAGKPIIDFVLHHLTRNGVQEIIIAGGYRVEDIRSHVSGHDYGISSLEVVDTGIDTQTAGRIRRLANRIEKQHFLLIWCDGLSDINFRAIMTFHLKNNSKITIGAVHPRSQFGELCLDGIAVTGYKEKPVLVKNWISGGYFAVDTEVVNLIEGDDDSWEEDILPKLVNEGSVNAYRNDGFWQCMDTAKEKKYLSDLQATGRAPWPQPDH